MLLTTAVVSVESELVYVTVLPKYEVAWLLLRDDMLSTRADRYSLVVTAADTCVRSEKSEVISLTSTGSVGSWFSNSVNKSVKKSVVFNEYREEIELVAVVDESIAVILIFFPPS
jgi:hypothetical protein